MRYRSIPGIIARAKARAGDFEESTIIGLPLTSLTASNSALPLESSRGFAPFPQQTRPASETLEAVLELSIIFDILYAHLLDPNLPNIRPERTIIGMPTTGAVFIVDPDATR